MAPHSEKRRSERKSCCSLSTLHQFWWQSILVTASLVALGVFLQKVNETAEHNVPCDMYLSRPQKEKEKIWQITQEQMSSEIKNHLDAFKEMQKTFPLFEHSNYTLLAGAPPWRKKLLVVGIASVRRSHGNHLLDTLKSLFQASSRYELVHPLVLVLLSDPDPQWLSQTVATISKRFARFIEARELLVVHGLLRVPLVRTAGEGSPCGELYSQQKAGFALLMNFASNLSDYFLLLEDNVHCTPRFVSTIYRTLAAWEDLPWVILEFSRLSISGRVFHTRDLSRLISFFFLFPKDTPTHLLLSEFRLLLNQHVPIHFSSSIFHSLAGYPESESVCFPAEREVVSRNPDNPAAVVFSNMVPIDYHMPYYYYYAYILNEEHLRVMEVEEGNFLTVILDKPHKIIRVAVLTGSEENGTYHLQKAHVLLGSGLMEDPRHCSHYTLLGPLVGGNLDQRVFYEEDSVEELSCIQLLVLASQESLLLIRQIKVWTEDQ
ncbi:alpha-1,3-mannosyl-glycoprotein 4-beta-N-acetylglucosaminyltransferase-like protein MGAT4E [Perognathus longimembris pacificus]|uniref:alpha-1,3-mannosyl-glycoprotein 4-beta-N-acetylglucosaminyltransferase-like protein MGAT4E n=1 Tax=Perognathus longimembris pacificus TaxID=214514 RepID=UPI0020193D71|nr:alpha-1,3-mannosyl-glycoprotein 4-beta-N-acetylglucosaminyltransferase-like protein MGAT4E [Perognathus longimembris pacificus]